MRALFAAALMAGLMTAAPARADTPPPGATADAEFDADGYRTKRFRAPVTVAPDPAKRIALAAAMRLHPGRDALFLDVVPVETGVRDSTTGAWTLTDRHETIPGAQWHPETGRAPVNPVLWRGLVAAVDAARRAHPRWPVVVFCRIDCWMAWNAARRLGHERKGVRWLAEGVEGWSQAGGTLSAATPVAIPAP